MLFSSAELLRREAVATGKDAVDRVQPPAGVRLRVHSGFSGGEAGGQPEQEPNPPGESRVQSRHENGGGAFVLVRG